MPGSGPKMEVEVEVGMEAGACGPRSRTSPSSDAAGLGATTESHGQALVQAIPTREAASGEVPCTVCGAA